MKHRLPILACIASCLLASCAGLQFEPAQIRPAASIATVAYLEQVPDARRAKALSELRLAAAKIQLVALSESPTAEALAIALNEVSAEPAYSAMAAALVRSYKPKADYLSTPEAKVALVNLSEGILDTVQTYEKSLPSK